MLTHLAVLGIALKTGANVERISTFSTSPGGERYVQIPGCKEGQEEAAPEISQGEEAGKERKTEQVIDYYVWRELS
jgi:hypothetical protein